MVSQDEQVRRFEACKRAAMAKAQAGQREQHEKIDRLRALRMAQSSNSPRAMPLCQPKA